MPDPFHDAIMEFIASVAAVRAAGQDLAVTDALKAAAETLSLLAAVGDTETRRPQRSEVPEKLARTAHPLTPLLSDAARPCRHAVGDRWYVDETYVKVAGRWRYVYRAIDQYGQIIDVYVSVRRDTQAARRVFMTALRAHGEPTEVVTDRAWTLRAVIDELIPAAFHNTAQYANNRIEADHGRLKDRLRPMRGRKRDRNARVIVRGHAFMQNIRRGHYELGFEARARRRVATAFTELARAI